jgi:hypothetical protein
MKDPWKRKDLITSGKDKGTERRSRGTQWNWTLYIGPNSLRRNRTNNNRKVCAISMVYPDTRQPLISRKREKDSKRNIALTP